MYYEIYEIYIIEMYIIYIHVLCICISQYILLSFVRMQIISILEQLSSLLLLEKRVKPSTYPTEGESTVSF